MTAVAEDTGIARYRSFLAVPHTRSLIGWALVARIPLGMTPLALLLLVTDQGASYAAAGAVVARTGSRLRSARSSRAGGSTGAARARAHDGAAIAYPSCSASSSSSRLRMRRSDRWARGRRGRGRDPARLVERPLGLAAGRSRTSFARPPTRSRRRSRRSSSSSARCSPPRSPRSSRCSRSVHGCSRRWSGRSGSCGSSRSAWRARRAVGSGGGLLGALEARGLRTLVVYAFTIGIGVRCGRGRRCRPSPRATARASSAASRSRRSLAGASSGAARRGASRRQRPASASCASPRSSVLALSSSRRPGRSRASACSPSSPGLPIAPTVAAVYGLIDPPLPALRSPSHSRGSVPRSRSGSPSGTALGGFRRRAGIRWALRRRAVVALLGAPSSSFVGRRSPATAAPRAGVRRTAPRRGLPYDDAPVAQGTERRTSNPRVGGSNPPGRMATHGRSARTSRRRQARRRAARASGRRARARTHPGGVQVSASDADPAQTRELSNVAEALRGER